MTATVRSTVLTWAASRILRAAAWVSARRVSLAVSVPPVRATPKIRRAGQEAAASRDSTRAIAATLACPPAARPTPCVWAISSAPSAGNAAQALAQWRAGLATRVMTTTQTPRARAGARRCAAAMETAARSAPATVVTHGASWVSLRISRSRSTAVRARSTPTARLESVCAPVTMAVTVTVGVCATAARAVAMACASPPARRTVMPLGAVSTAARWWAPPLSAAARLRHAAQHPQGA